MSSKYIIPIIGIHAILFAVLFHNQSLAVNLWIYELVLIGFLAWRKELPYKSIISKIVIVCLISSGISLILVSSQWGIAINILVLLVFLGNLIYPEVRSVISALGLAIHSIPISQMGISKIKGKPNAPLSRIFGRVKQWYIFTIPLVIIVVFILLYSGANAQFGKLIADFFTEIGLFFQRLFQHFEFALLLTLIFGVLAGNMLFFRTGHARLEASDLKAPETLIRTRIRTKRYFPFNGLRRELRAGVFLFFVLNALLTLLNVLDIQNVWLKNTAGQVNFSDSVHEGIYLLIISILISIVLVLYYFRANLNFYCHNNTLKILVYLWLLQNALLVISAGVRNFRYIEYCALAYKRIGVWIFLAAVLVGLFTVLIKVYQKRSSFFLFRTNSLSVLIILVLTSFVNWDIIIAKYNIQHSDINHIDNRFLLSLSDKALPYIDLPETYEESINDHISENNYWDRTIVHADYYKQQLQVRKVAFIAKWENYTVLEWNYPEYVAYKALKTH